MGPASTPAVTNVGLIGCGAITQRYYSPSLMELERKGLVRVCAIFDPNAEQREALGQSFRSARKCASLDEFAGSKPALVIVASPARFHAQQTIAMLKAGCAVLCEKPMACSGDEAEQMIAAARSAGTPLAIGLFRRFFPATRLIRQYIVSGTLGRPLSFEFTEGGVFDWPAQSASFFQKGAAHGGVLLDLGVHLLDLALWWFGEPMDVEYEDDAMGGLEINARVRLRFADGLAGTARLSRDWSLANRYLIRFERGWLAWQVGNANGLEMGINSHGLALKGKVWASQAQNITTEAWNYSQSFVAQLLNVLGVMNGTEALVVPGEEGIRSLRLIERCYGQRRLWEMPWFEAVERQRARELQPA